jgi:hypothetical protein
MSPSPQSQRWPSDRAILFVHGVGNAQPGTYEPLVNQVKDLLGPEANRFAFYFLYYDQLNEWAAAKMNAAGLVADLVRVIRGELASTAVQIANVMSEFACDVIWPVLLADARNAVRAAYVAQLQQILLDGKANGKAAEDLHVSIIAHSLGCFHTYETLHEAVSDPGLGLAPATWNTQFENVIYIASPVQLIRHVAQKMSVAIPQRDKLHCLSAAGLSLPAERDSANQMVPVVRKKTVSITGNLDPVGGHFFRAKADWAYMNLPGQTPIIDPQIPAQIPGLTDDESFVSVLQSALLSGEPPRITPQNPHDWGAYVQRHSSDLRGWLTA